MPRLSKIGAAALAAFGWTSGSAGPANITATYLAVAGGGAGGTSRGGGGGAGGLLSGTTSLSLNTSYTILIGAGGAPANYYTIVSGNGGNSQFATVATAIGGGGGASDGATAANGGSGGGGGTAGTGTSGQGNAGGNGTGTNPAYAAGGGGGAGTAGSNFSSQTAGSGGAGVSSTISGTSVYYAGGGGGGTNGGGTAGSGGNGGGGAGSNVSGGAGNPGTANTGGGGGGGGGWASPYNLGGQGGSGVVIISYAGAQQFGGGVVTSVGGNTIHTFNTSGTLSPLNSLSASYLLVAGGGGGSLGGAGAGGFLSGSGVTIDTNSIYLVTVGAGGAGATTEGQGTSGANSVFSIVSTSAVGGGGGGGYSATSSLRNGLSGGSGGGGGARSGVGAGTGGAGTSGQGYAGGNAFDNGVAGSPGGGGGGAGAVGANAAGTSVGGNGGVGLSSSISGTSKYYAGGGGGGAYLGTLGTGGNGGGGSGVQSGTPNAGTANTGGGGGGQFNTPTDAGGAGGSGIVIISYAGSVQQMAGGTVTISGGNVIHTFTSSGYLTPLTYVGNSLRFRSAASAYLSRTPTVAGNQQKFTLSTWVKRGSLSSTSYLLGNFVYAGSGATNQQFNIYFNSSNCLQIEDYENSFSGYSLITTQVFRDPAAWYHIVVAFDTTQTTSSNRIKLYVNGSQVTSFSTANYPVQNLNTYMNTTVRTGIGALIGILNGSNYDVGSYYDGEMTTINFIDGQALTPNSFGTFNSYGVWQPITYGGSYGTNGFYLPFTNTANTTALGYDFSPQGNNWTTNNISLTTGSTYDSMTDVPTLTSATTANYCTLNPLQNGGTMTNGNLTFAGNTGSTIGTIAPSSGKWYFEATVATLGTSAYVGLADTTWFGTDTGWSYSQVYVYISSGSKGGNGSAGSYGASYTTGDVIGVAMDLDGGTITFYKNNTSQGTAFNTSVAGKALRPFLGTTSPSTTTYNVTFGQQPFAYTPPTGFKALNTYNLPTSTIVAGNKYMDATLYTGTGSNGLTVTNGGFYPDLIWAKSRSAAYYNTLLDYQRGVAVRLFSNLADAESNNGCQSSFNTNGFTLNADAGGVNNSGTTYVAWQWNAGSGTSASNTSGSITSNVDVNTTAGFSIVKYTGTGSIATIGHGLGVAPAMMIIKARNAAQGWLVYHQSIGNTGFVYLNDTAAANYSINGWNNTSPTSSVFTTGVNGYTNASGQTQVAYCWSEIAGFSKFGSYTGNGSADGPFIYTGFRPKWLMIKRTDATQNWTIVDTSRDTYNVANQRLFANSSSAEDTGIPNYADILSNGFKLRDSNISENANGSTYIYAAFAENPFKYANAR